MLPTPTETRSRGKKEQETSALTIRGRCCNARAARRSEGEGSARLQMPQRRARERKQLLRLLPLSRTAPSLRVHSPQLFTQLHTHTQTQISSEYEQSSGEEVWRVKRIHMLRTGSDDPETKASNTTRASAELKRILFHTVDFRVVLALTIFDTHRLHVEQ